MNNVALAGCPVSGPNREFFAPENLILNLDSLFHLYAELSCGAAL